MKRASLSALPARPKPQAADLTDRLLEREAAAPASEPGEAPAAFNQTPALPPAPAKRANRKRTRPTAQTQAQASAAPSAPPAENPAPTLDQALEQAAGAAEALTLAARSAPARYELALRYRLEALAHHVRQVTDFIAGRTRP